MRQIKFSLFLPVYSFYKEVLQILETFRKVKKKIFFGITGKAPGSVCFSYANKYLGIQQEACNHTSNMVT